MQGRFDFQQLRAWKEQLRSVVFRDPQVVFLDADEYRNRVTVGVATAGDSARVRDLIEPLGLPVGTVGFEVRGHTQVTATLRNAYSPRIGGLGISFEFPFDPNGQLQDCTHGPRISYYPNGAFITNSHCTGGLSQAFVMNSVPIGQGGEYIGREITDEPLFQDSYGCPVGRWCCNSDAAIIQYETGITKEYGIAFTGLPPCTGGTWCNVRITIQGIVLVTEEDYAVMNEDLNKTGQRTGWTRGPVTQTCADTEYDIISGRPLALTSARSCCVRSMCVPVRAPETAGRRSISATRSSLASPATPSS
ncbi:MAG: hypothetical protein ACREJ4_07005 [Candidatus Methylomirabilaceae bacterium]